MPETVSVSMNSPASALELLNLLIPHGCHAHSRDAETEAWQRYLVQVHTANKWCSQDQQAPNGISNQHRLRSRSLPDTSQCMPSLSSPSSHPPGNRFSFLSGAGKPPGDIAQTWAQVVHLPGTKLDIGNTESNEVWSLF